MRNEFVMEISTIERIQIPNTAQINTAFHHASTVPYGSGVITTTQTSSAKIIFESKLTLRRHLHRHDWHSLGHVWTFANFLCVQYPRHGVGKLTPKKIAQVVRIEQQRFTIKTAIEVHPPPLDALLH